VIVLFAVWVFEPSELVVGHTHVADSQNEVAALVVEKVAAIDEVLVLQESAGIYFVM
jgi:hypothetical protein